MLFLLGMPIGFSMLFIGILGLCFIVPPDVGISLLGSDLFAQFLDYSLTAFPMFILAGSLAFTSGMGDRIFTAAYALSRRLPGSLAVASTAACAGFAAICGSSVATAATMGKVAIPIMRQHNYDVSLATGSVAAAGALGPLIPPSVIFIIYALLTEQSVGKLFVAGILPGILLTALLVITVIVLCLRNPSLAPTGPPSTRKDKTQGLIGLCEAVVLFGFIIFGLSLGWFTPTQGGAALAAAVLFLALLRRQISWSGLLNSLKDTARISCMIIIIMAGGVIFSRFMAYTYIPFILADWLASLQVASLVIVAIIAASYVILGFFMDGLSVVILTLPIIFPTVTALGFDPIWFGVMIVLVGETAVVTPPVGVNVYVIHGVVRDVPIEKIFKGIFPFLIAQLVAIVLVLLFPQIATFLPNLLN